MTSSSTPVPHAFDTRKQHGFGLVTLLCVALLYAPIFILVIYSFNENRSVTIWTQFSARWYAVAYENAGMFSAAMLSLKVAVIASFVATIAATMAALAMTSSSHLNSKALVHAVINQPLMAPEIVTGVATLTIFALIKVATGISGIGYLILAHVVFCVPFAYLPVKARLDTMDETLSMAAADLYASSLRAFAYVTFPLLLPGIVAGFMLAFVTSLDNVVISMLVSGPGETTLPVYIIGQIRRGITPELNAVSTLLVLISAALIVGYALLAQSHFRSDREEN